MSIPEQGPVSQQLTLFGTQVPNVLQVALHPSKGEPHLQSFPSPLRTS